MLVEGIKEIENINALNYQQNRELKINEQKDNEALFLIQGASNQTIFPRISGVVQSKQAWTILVNIYQGAHTAKLQTLKRKFRHDEEPHNHYR